MIRLKVSVYTAFGFFLCVKEVVSNRFNLPSSETILSGRLSDFSYFIKSDTIAPMKILDVTEEYYKDAKPGIGACDHDTNTLEEDRMTTEFLHRVFGGNIRTLEVEKAGKRDLKTPDSIWNETYWEYKKVSNKSSINDRMRKAWKKQQEFAKRNNNENKSIGFVFDILGRKQ